MVEVRSNLDGQSLTRRFAQLKEKIRTWSLKLLDRDHNQKNELQLNQGNCAKYKHQNYLNYLRRVLEKNTRKDPQNVANLIPLAKAAFEKNSIPSTRICGTLRCATMTVMEDALLTIRSEYPDLDAEVRAILLARAQEGATISEIGLEYRKNTGLHFPVYNNITDYLLSIPGVNAICTERGTLLFNIVPTDKTRHLYDMVINQKPRSSTSSGYSHRYNNHRMKGNFNRNYGDPNNNKNNPDSSDGWAPKEQNNICFEDNWNHWRNRFVHKADAPPCPDINDAEPNSGNADKPIPTTDAKNNSILNQIYGNMFKRGHGVRASSPAAPKSSSSDTWYTSDSDYEAHLLDFPLLGDDFLLYLARMELKCKFKRHSPVFQSGLCVSGQTIRAAIRRVRKMQTDRRVIINIGSVDIVQGRPLVQIEHDFRQLVNLLYKRGLNPILTTLAPLANHAHDEQIKRKLERFNEFIKREGHCLTVVDIWKCLVNARGQTLFDCYQTEPRKVTGAAEPFVFWNKIGRQRVLKLIEESLEY